AGTLTILARPGAQILPALNRLIHGSGWQVSGVRTEHGQLEEVFRQLTREPPA
ncbi:ABC transporter ATP-binding protein, partial [Pseudomonas aeruginosa]|nr:ABC transporter ATP-binding protein [Pseudomonas aeruginosa]